MHRAHAGRASADAVRARVASPLRGRHPLRSSRHDRSDRPAVPRLPRAVPGRSALRLRQVLRPARGRSTTTTSSRRTLTREAIEARPRNLWRYRELLPITGEPRTGFTSGFTPLVQRRSPGRAPRRHASSTSRTTGVNHPTLSYKDRVVSVAATRAVELGFTVFGCASTGNLGNSVAAHAARLGLDCYVFIPDNLEPGKVVGSAIYQPTADRHQRQLRRRQPAVHADCRQVPLGLRQHQPAHLLRRRRQDVRLRDRRAARLALPAARRLAGRRRHAAAAHRARLPRGCARSAWSSGELPKIYAAQAAGCAPVVHALHAGIDHPDPVKPEHHRQVDRHRQPGRRVPGDRGAQGDRRLGRDGRPTTRSSPASTCSPRPKASSPSRPAARRWRSTQEADRAGPHPARRIDRRLHHRQRLQDRPRWSPTAWRGRSRSAARFKDFEAFLATDRHAVGPRSTA